MTKVIHIDEVANRLCNLYYETIIGKINHDETVKERVEQLKKEGYRFELLHNDYLPDLFERLQMVLAEKSKAVESKWFEQSHNLRNEEIRLKEKLKELVYFTRVKDKTMAFMCARIEDEWILK